MGRVRGGDEGHSRTGARYASKAIDRLENRLTVDLTTCLLALAQAGSVTATIEDRLARAGDRLVSADRAELLGRAPPERIAAVLASAGFDSLRLRRRSVSSAFTARPRRLR